MVSSPDLEFFIDPNRCIGCQSCVAACSECDTHRGLSMIHLEYVRRPISVQTIPVICMAQGPAARHGELDYVIQGKMIGGFALVAWPAEHRVSGVKTFIINHDGVLYEKDLGPDTAKIAGEMTAYNPDKTWKKVPDTGN